MDGFVTVEVGNEVDDDDNGACDGLFLAFFDELFMLLLLLVKRELLESGLEFFFPTFVGDCDSIFEVVKSGDIERVEEFEMDEVVEGIERTPFKIIEELIKVDGCGELKSNYKNKMNK